MERTIVMYGMSHRTAPVEIREKLAVESQSICSLLRDLVATPDVEEALVLSTCNRVEIYAVGPDTDSALRSIRAHTMMRSGLSQRALTESGFTHVGRDAVHHAMRVASSLDSLVVGEPQILGQVKAAFRESEGAGTTGPILHRAFQSALSAGKRVRTETQVAANAVSISFAAVQLAKKVFGSLERRKALVIGAGKMGVLALKHMQAAGVSELHLANRSLDRAQEAARALGGIPHGLNELDELLQDVDIVVTCTGSQHYVVRFDALQQVVARRKYRPLFIIDIAVPRDVDPRCEQLSNVYLFDVDDLERVVESNRRARMTEARRAEEIVSAEADQFMVWMGQHRVVPTIVQLREKVSRLKDAELERLVRQHPDLDPQVQKAIERAMNAIVNKILHAPTASLRKASGDEGPVLAAAARSLFALNEDLTPTGSDT